MVVVRFAGVLPGLALAMGLSTCHATPEADRPASLPSQAPAAPPMQASAAPARPPAASPPAVAAPTTFMLRGTTYTLGKDRSFPSCERLEAWLAFFPRDKVLGAYCERCSDSTCHDGNGDESGGPWSFAKPDGAADGFWCNELQYLRHAIGAEHGLRVPSGRFRASFGHRREYRPDASLTETDLPAVARENLAWIDGYLARCNETKLQVTARDAKIVDDWFRANAVSKALLPGKLTDNCKPVSEAGFRAILGSEPYMRFSPRTPIVRSESSSCDVAVPKGGRVLSVHVGASLSAEGCTECGGHQILEMVIDASDRIVALGAILAG